jgi:hypothetical protein
MQNLEIEIILQNLIETCIKDGMTFEEITSFIIDFVENENIDDYEDAK